MGVEGGVVDFGQRQAVRDDRLPKLFVRIHDDVSSIEQPRLGEVGNRAPSPIGGKNRITKCSRRSKNPSLKRPGGPVAPE
jgi:hypothetical protein